MVDIRFCHFSELKLWFVWAWHHVVWYTVTTIIVMAKPASSFFTVGSLLNTKTADSSNTTRDFGWPSHSRYSDWTVRGLNPGWWEIFLLFRTPPDGLWGPHVLLQRMRTGALFLGYSGRGVTLTTQPHLAPRLWIKLYLCSPSVPAWHVTGRPLPSQEVSLLGNRIYWQHR
jgi:hypothetical protein